MLAIEVCPATSLLHVSEWFARSRTAPSALSVRGSHNCCRSDNNHRGASYPNTRLAVLCGCSCTAHPCGPLDSDSWTDDRSCRSVARFVANQQHREFRALGHCWSRARCFGARCSFRRRKALRKEAHPDSERLGSFYLSIPLERVGRSYLLPVIPRSLHVGLFADADFLHYRSEERLG